MTFANDGIGLCANAPFSTRWDEMDGEAAAWEDNIAILSGTE